jgi:hypothetical protein
LVIVHNAEISISVQVSLLYPDLHFFGNMPRNGSAGLYGSSTFSFLRRLHTIFYSGCTNFHSHQHPMTVPFSPHSCQHLLLFVFFFLIFLLLC